MNSMKDEFITITLDYDKIAWTECKKRIDFILNDHKDILDIDVYSSPLNDGYHLYVNMTKYMKWNEIMRLRRRWHDDGKRIIIDLMKTRNETKMIMFRSKTRHGYKFNEIFIDRFYHGMKEVKILKSIEDFVYAHSFVSMKSEIKVNP